MTSKKNRIAKGVGASALAVATLASGLSFGAASATASEEQERAEASTTYAKFFAKMQPTGLYGEDNGAFRWYSARPDLSIVDKPGWYNYNQTMQRAETESEARSKATPLSTLSASEWRLWKNEASQKCYYVSAASSNGSFLRSTVSLQSCNETNRAQWFKLSDSGDVVAKNLPAGMKLDSMYDYHHYANGLTTVRTHLSFTNRDWDGPTYGDGWNPGIEVGLSGSVTFGASVDERAVVSGKTVAGGAVEVRRGSTVVGTDTANASGEYSVAIAAPDKAGDDKLTVALVVDGADKKTVSVTAAYGAGVAITAPTNGDVVSGQYTITGTAQAGSNVSVQVNGGAARPVTVSGNGQWSQDVTLPMGERTITATQKSKGANTTTSSVTVNPGESSTAPLMIATPADGSTVETDTKRVQFSGTAEPGARVQILTQTATPRPIVDTYANAQGEWSQLGGDLNFGVAYTLDTVYTPQGEPSVHGTHRVTLNEANPGVEQPFAFTTPQNNSTVVAPNKQVRLAGVGATGTKVTIWNYRTKDRVVGTATVGKDGMWEVPAASLNNQDNRYELHVEYVLAGQTAPTVLTHNITVKAAEGVERPFDFATPGEGTTVIAPDKQVTFSGTGMTGTKVEIFNYVSKDRVVASTIVDDKGEWTATGELNNQDSAYALHTEFTAPGQTVQTMTRNITVKSEASADLPYQVGTPAEGSNVTLENYRATDNNGEATISGTGKTGGMVKVWNYESKNRIVIKGGEILKVDENGEWSGVGELAGGMNYKLHIEYFAPGADLDGEPTSVVTRSFNTVAPTK